MCACIYACMYGQICLTWTSVDVLSVVLCDFVFMYLRIYLCVCLCLYVCTCTCTYVCFLFLCHRMDILTGPQTMSSQAKAFSSSSPIVTARAEKNPIQGLECHTFPNLHLKHSFILHLIQILEVTNDFFPPLTYLLHIQ